MAFPTVATTATTPITTATTTPALNLPASIASGDTLLALYRCASAGAISWPAGWTELFDDDTDAADDQISCAWRKADGTEGASISLTTASGKGAGICYRISGAADPTVTPPEYQLAVATTVNPNPPSLSPTGGAKDYLWLVLLGCQGERTSPPTYPTNYGSNQLAADSGTAGAGTTNVRVAGATRELNAASEDPGTFNLSGSAESTAITVAVHPAAATNDRRGQIYYAAMSVPNAPRRGQIYFAAMSVPNAPRRGQIYYAAMSVPDAPRRGQIYFAAMSVPDAPRRAQIYYAAMSVPDAPTNDRRGQIYFAAMSVPDAPRRAIITYAALSVPDAPRRAQIYFAEMSVPTAPRRGQIYYAAMSVPDAPTTDRRVQIYFAALAVPDAPVTRRVGGFRRYLKEIEPEFGLESGQPFMPAPGLETVEARPLPNPPPAQVPLTPAPVIQKAKAFIPSAELLYLDEDEEFIHIILAILD